VVLEDREVFPCLSFVVPGDYPLNYTICSVELAPASEQILLLKKGGGTRDEAKLSSGSTVIKNLHLPGP
jgi:hypothetical protein